LNALGQAAVARMNYKCVIISTLEKTFNQEFLMSANPYKPWGVYTITLLILGINERLITPENGLLDGIVDAAIITVSCVGAVVCWFLSYRSLNTPTDLLNNRTQVAITWLLGPIVGVTAAISPAVDIDGGLLLFYPPVFGLFLTTFVLPVLFILRHRNAKRNDAVHSEAER